MSVQAAIARRLVGALSAPLTRSTSYAVQRRAMAASTALLGMQLRALTRPATLGGVEGEWVGRDGAPGRALLYLHGGGYVIGSPGTHRPLVARLAERLHAQAFTPDYRLAPEHPAPAALDDALAAYRALRADHETVIVAGDSAGGGLTLALALLLRDNGEQQPDALGLICPWLDLSPEAALHRHDSGREPLLTAEALERWAGEYAHGIGRDDPRVSPLRAEDLSGLPPIVLQSAGDDLLLADAERLDAKLPGIIHQRHPGLWHVFHALLGVVPEADAAVDQLATALLRALGARPRPPRVAIIGAGMSGLCMAATLQRAGHSDFVIHEKAEEVGGTWRENTYPGLSCDVPAHYYSYTFAPNPGWRSSFAPGAEIQRYFVGTATKLGLRPRIRFGSEVTEARWDGSRWQLQTTTGPDAADVLITATGVLHHPRTPDIPGLDRFGGDAFHSARWDHTVALTGRKVAVIGTGSTGAQIVGALGGRAGSLKLFQRTAQWVAPVPNIAYPAPLRGLLHVAPPLTRLAYRVNERALAGLLSPAVLRDGWQRALMSGLCRAHLRLAVRDPELRARLTPADEPMCKRLVMSTRFYPALQRPGVELVTEGIDHVDATGIVTRDGVHHEVDTIVLATGFDPRAFMRPMNIVGEDGLTLDEAWGERPHGYRSVALPGFPNLFTLMGPHSPFGNHSLIAVAEVQCAYALRWIQRIAEGEITHAAPTPEATRRFNEDMRDALPGTIWASGCDSWYLDADGIPALWPWSPAHHRRLLAEPQDADFAICRSRPSASVA